MVEIEWRSSWRRWRSSGDNWRWAARRLIAGGTVVELLGEVGVREVEEEVEEKKKQSRKDENAGAWGREDWEGFREFFVFFPSSLSLSLSLSCTCLFLRNFSLFFSFFSQFASFFFFKIFFSKIDK